MRREITTIEDIGKEDIHVLWEYNNGVNSFEISDEMNNIVIDGENALKLVSFIANKISELIE